MGKHLLSVECRKRAESEERDATGLEYCTHFFHADEIKRSVHGAVKLSTFTIALEAWRRGLKIAFLDARPYKFEISDGKTTVKFNGSMPETTTRQAFRDCNNKSIALSLMREAGVPVPVGYRMDGRTTSFDELVRLAHELSYPVVLKPVQGSKGRGVFSNIQNDEQLKQCFQYIVEELKKPHIILEEHFEGEDYRVQVVGDRAVAATWRRPASIIGDGRSTVTELIRAKNKQRRENPALSKELATVDFEVDRYLTDQGYTYDSVPLKGARVRLRGKANLSTGGDIVDVTCRLTDEIKDIAVRAVQAVPGLSAAGVDIMIDRAPDRLQDSGRALVIELNPRAHMGGHMFPSEGPGHNVAGAFIDHFFPEVPQLTEEKAARLSFDVDDVLAPLRMGVVDRTELKPLPEHRYPARKVYRFPEVYKVRAEARDRISRNSRKYDISGMLRATETGIELRAAGEEKPLEDFLRIVESSLEVKAQETGPWEGVVWKGFKTRTAVPLA